MDAGAGTSGRDCCSATSIWKCGLASTIRCGRCEGSRTRRWRLFRRVLGAVRADGSTLDPAREASAGDAVAGVLFDPSGAAVDGAGSSSTSLFRWFVGLGVDDAARDHSTFSKNRERLLEGGPRRQAVSAVLAQPRVKRLLSTDHFSVDGTLVEAWASMKSFRPKDGARTSRRRKVAGETGRADFHGQKRTNETHASTTDPKARRYRKGPGKEAKLCFMGHALMENRNGLVIDACLTEASGHAERIAALHMIEPRADRPRPTHAWRRQGLRRRGLRQRTALDERHAARSAEHQRAARRRSTAARRATGYAVSQRIRKRIEESLRLDQDGSPARSEQKVPAAASASDGRSPSRPPPTPRRGCQSLADISGKV